MAVDLSTQCKYAIRAMGYLATRQSNRLVPISEIGDQLDVPRLFLAKILAALSRNGLVSSRRGPGGGVKLGRPPAEVPLAEIVRVLQPGHANGDCFLGLDRCDGHNPCPLHETWSELRRDLGLALGQRTLEDLKRVR